MTDAPTEWDTITDPTQTFTAAVPRGWQHQVTMVPTPATKHTLVSATSPGGDTRLHTGDPDMPMFIEPQAVVAGVPPGLVARPGTPATQLLPEWVRYRYGRAPGFRTGSVAEFAPVLEPVLESVRRAGAQLAWATSARLDFEFGDGGRVLRAVLLMATFSYGPVWVAYVHGVTTAEDPEPFVPSLLHMVGSVRPTDAEHQRQVQQRMASAAQHQMTMANIAANTAMMQSHHAQSMAGLDASARAHQERMASLHASQDAHNAAYEAQQAGIDAQHAAYVAGVQPGSADPGQGGTPAQDFINMIREERTVIDSEGYAHQVEAGYDRYFYRRHDGTWIGLQQHQELSDVPGVDPNDYEEVRIQS